MANAIQILFNGHGGTVAKDVPAALQYVADNLFHAKGNAASLQASLASEWDDHAFLAGEGLAPSLAHLLSRMARAAGRESVEIVVHDLDAAPGRASSVLHYDLVSPSDPVACLVDAVISVAHDDADIDEVADNLYLDCRAAIAHAAGFLAKPEEVLAKLRAQQETFGYPDGHRLAVIPSAAEVDGRHEAVLKDLPRRISSAFRAMAPELVAPQATPSH